MAGTIRGAPIGAPNLTPLPHRSAVRSSRVRAQASSSAIRRRSRRPIGVSSSSTTGCARPPLCGVPVGMGPSCDPTAATGNRSSRAAARSSDRRTSSLALTARCGCWVGAAVTARNTAMANSSARAASSGSPPFAPVGRKRFQPVPTRRPPIARWTDYWKPSTPRCPSGGPRHRKNCCAGARRWPQPCAKLSPRPRYPKAGKPGLPGPWAASPNAIRQAMPGSNVRPPTPRRP